MDRKLIDYYPEVLKEFREFQIITESEQGEVKAIWNGLDDALNDQFVHTATVNGINRWEKILKIMPKATASLEDRRFLVLTKISDELPYTWGMLERRLELLCGLNHYILELDHQQYILKIGIALTARNSFHDVEDLLRAIVPANMNIDLSLLYNQYKIVKQFTHSQMKQNTHMQLRNEVVINGN